ncbi:terpene synthase family protein [Streptomyces sp. S186]|uniref:terpene synthase family protein n=1 Tax=Streptomyces sp. S186 TaxID=3434395 RepID=UPI003F66471A
MVHVSEIMRLEDFGTAIPFPSKVNPHLEAIRDGHERWLRKHHLISDDADAESFKEWKMVELAARAYPEATARGLRIAADAMGWFFRFDDLFDGGPLACDLARASKVIAAATRIAGNPGFASELDEVPVIGAFRDIRRRSVRGMSRQWVKRSAAHWRGYFEGNLKETVIRATRAPISLAELIKLRRYTIAAAPSADLNERACGFEISEKVGMNPYFRGMEADTADAIIFVNDLWSANKEESAGEPFNAVSVIQNEAHCDRRTAQFKVADLLDDCIRRFRRRRERFADWLAVQRMPERERSAASRQVAHLQGWIRANYDWSLESSRYRELL